MSKNNGNGVKPVVRSNLAEWKAKRLHELELPSGLVVSVREVSLVDLAMLGQVPNTLMSVIIENKENEQALEKALGNNMEDFGKLLDNMAKASIIEPMIGNGENELSLSEMPSGDKLFIFNYMNREAEQLKSFRAGEEQPDQPASGL